jgi:hypothetical protein
VSWIAKVRAGRLGWLCVSNNGDCLCDTLDEQQERWLDDGCPTYAYAWSRGLLAAHQANWPRAATTPLPLSMLRRSVRRQE